MEARRPKSPQKKSKQTTSPLSLFPLRPTSTFVIANSSSYNVFGSNVGFLLIVHSINCKWHTNVIIHTLSDFLISKFRCT